MSLPKRILFNVLGIPAMLIYALVLAVLKTPAQNSLYGRLCKIDYLKLKISGRKKVTKKAHIA